MVQLVSLVVIGLDVVMEVRKGRAKLLLGILVSSLVLGAVLRIDFDGWYLVI